MDLRETGHQSLTILKYDKAVMAYMILNILCPESLQGKLTLKSIKYLHLRQETDIKLASKNKTYRFSKETFSVLRLHCEMRYLSK